MPQHGYLDFDLLIEPGSQGGYRARVLKSPVGEIPPVPLTIPFSDLELENFLLKVGRPRRQGVRGIKPPEVAAVRDFGAQLFDAVFRDRLRSALATSLDHVEGLEDTGLRVRLRLSDCPELADLPWEFLYNSDIRRYLALSEWTPVVRYLELQGRIRPLAVDPPLRILVMAASPTDFELLDAVAEWDKIRQALDGLQQAGRVQLDRVPAGTLADLRRALMASQYHVFHFIGHGVYDPEAQDGLLALEGPGGRAHFVSGTDLGAMLHDHKSLRLAVLNSCEGARGGLRDPYSGTAQSLIYQGIPAVVAMQFEITDRAAIAFAHSLYETVANGYPLDAAMAAARHSVRDDANPLEWATPVLYLRAPDGRIFDVPPDALPAKNSRVRPSLDESILNASETVPAGLATESDETGTPDKRASTTPDPYAVPGSEWTARATRVNTTLWSWDWRVDVQLTEEQHSIEYRDLSVWKGILLIDGVRAMEVRGFSTSALGATTFQLADGDKRRSLRFAGSWLSVREQSKTGEATLEIWVDGQVLLRLDLMPNAAQRPASVPPTNSGQSRDPQSIQGGTAVSSEIAQVSKLAPAEGGQVDSWLLAVRHSKPIRAVAFSPDGTRFVTASDDTSVRVWTSATGQPLLTIPHQFKVRSVVFSPDGKHLATGGENNHAHIWDARTGAEVLKLKVGRWPWFAQTVAFSPDGTRLAIGSDNKSASIWDTRTGTELRKFAHAGSVKAVAFSPDGTWLATGSDDKSVRIWNARTGEPHLTIPQKATVQSVAFSPDGKHLATGGENNHAHIWDARTGAEVLKLKVGRWPWFAQTVAFSPDGTRLAIGSDNKSASIWDTGSGTELRKFAHAGSVKAVAFSPDGTRFATSSDDKTVRIWEFAEG